LLKVIFNVKLLPMLARFGSYLFPSVLVHCAVFVALASAPATVQSSSTIEAVEFVTITDRGGGRTGDDRQIGDATEPVDPPQQKFRQVRPNPRPARTAPIVEPSENPKPQPKQGDAGDGGETRVADANDEGPSQATSHSLIMGSAGTDPNARSAGSGSGDEGIDRRSALRAWLREIQREVNKIATRNYPSSAVRMGLEGKLRLGITIGVDGRILGVRVLSSSGHATLDDSATESVMALNIPAPPAALQWSEREISLPIRYALQ
jgi:TonB family protein